MKREGQFAFPIFGITILHILSNSAFTRVIGHIESTRTIYEVHWIVVKWFRRQLIMTQPKFGQKGIFFSILKYSFFYIYIFELFNKSYTEKNGTILYQT